VSCGYIRSRRALSPGRARAQSALRLKPTFTDAYNNLASALVQQGRVPAALQCYQAALAVDPTLVPPLLNPPRTRR
jgi:tetratricopeptide (TPR) repeat protein